MTERLLRVTAPHFVAGAVFARDESGGWRVRRTAPILGWMRGKSAGEIGAYLRRKGWRFEWLNAT